MEKEKLLHLKKKIIAYTMLATVSLTTLNGCNDYNIKEDGTIEYIGKLSYDLLSNYYILTLDNNGNNVYYVVEIKDELYDGRRVSRANLKDIKTDKNIATIKAKSGKAIDLEKIEDIEISISVDDFKFVNLQDYVVKNNNIKENYDLEDIDEILNLYKQEQEKNDISETSTKKVLTKSKTNQNSRQSNKILL